MTANILTPGHIKCLEFLADRDLVVVGLLTAKALEGYKEEHMPFEDRKYILEAIAKGIGDIRVVPQDSLNPQENLQKYMCDYIASGDGWESEELEAIKEMAITPIDIALDGEKEKQYSSSSIIQKL